MAIIPNPAALLAGSGPFPWQGAQLLAFRGGNDPGMGALSGVGSAGAIGAQVVSDAIPAPWRPTAPVPLPVGGLAPAAIAQAAGALYAAASDAAGALVEAVGQLWGALNGANYTAEIPASYAYGAIKGNWNPTGTNIWRYEMTGTYYNTYPTGFGQDPATGRYRTENVAVPGPVPAGWIVTIVSGKTPSTFNGLTTWNNSDQIWAKKTGSPDDLKGFINCAGWGLDLKIVILVSPTSGVGVPYPPTVAAIPSVPDAAIIVPSVPALSPITAPVLDPLRQPLQPGASPSGNPAALPTIPRPLKDVDPLVEVGSGVGGGLTTTITTLNGILRKVAPQQLPRLAPTPSRSIPGTLPQTLPNGEIQLAPAPAPVVTATDARQYGTQTITSGAPATSPQEVANEIGRIEQKLGLMLPLLEAGPSWLDGVRDAIANKIIQDLIEAIQGGTGSGEVGLADPVSYLFSPPYDTPGVGLAEQGVYEIPAAGFGPATIARLDAIAEALQVMAAWRVKLSKGNAPSPNVTLTAFGIPDP